MVILRSVEGVSTQRSKYFAQTGLKLAFAGGKKGRVRSVGRIGDKDLERMKSTWFAKMVGSVEEWEKSSLVGKVEWLLETFQIL